MDVSLGALWLPILLSAAGIFFASFVMWMISPHHKSDFGPVPDEDGLMGTLREQGIKLPGQYVFPHCASTEQMKDPAFIEKYDAGPSGIMILRPQGSMSMGKNLAKSFVYNVLLVLIPAYLATLGIQKGADGKLVFRFISTGVWLGCSGAVGWNMIWWNKSGSSTAKEVFDGLVYGVIAGAIFTAMWPG
ncbi:MAG: hypothetical protein ACYTHK_08980 [Planctomycetota bacterium]|jgi:hypothetical protein